MNESTFQGNGKVTYVPVIVNGKQAKQTNADRIRAMTDKELAEWIFNTLWSYDAICEKRKKDWLDWLKQPTVDNGACSANETSEKVQNE